MKLTDYIKAKRGNAKALADKLDISPSFLSQLANGQAPISPERAVQIEYETDGQVTRKDLFPDIWPQIWPELITSPRGDVERRRAPGRRETDKKIGRRTRKPAQP